MLDEIALMLAVIGGLNWGSVGLLNFDIVAWLFGSHNSIASRIIYIVIAIASIWYISILFKDTSDTA